MKYMFEWGEWPKVTREEVHDMPTKQAAIDLAIRLGADYVWDVPDDANPSTVYSKTGDMSREPSLVPIDIPTLRFGFMVPAMDLSEESMLWRGCVLRLEELGIKGVLLPNGICVFTQEQLVKLVSCTEPAVG